MGRLLITRDANPDRDHLEHRLHLVNPSFKRRRQTYDLLFGASAHGQVMRVNGDALVQRESVPLVPRLSVGATRRKGNRAAVRCHLHHCPVHVSTDQQRKHLPDDLPEQGVRLKPRLTNEAAHRLVHPHISSVRVADEVQVTHAVE